MQIGRSRRVRLASLPTALEEMQRLSKVLDGPRLFIKRDDNTGLALGGNKARKLEFIMADAISKGSDVVISSCGIQSNWMRMLCAAARKLGMEVVAVLRTAQFKEEPTEYDGNLLLDFLLGADIRIVHGGIEEEPTELMKNIAEDLKKKGKTPYVIEGGGENPLGSIGYVNASLELLDQVNGMGIEVNYIVHASGGGATQAGLTLGMKALNTGVKVIGISVVYRKDELVRHVTDMANGSAKLLNLNLSVTPDEVTVFDEYVGQGYGIPTNNTIDAIKLLARTEGILLDPVYTGKAMAGLIDLIRKGYFTKKDTVIFLHTGGTPAIFPYRGTLVPAVSSNCFVPSGCSRSAEKKNT